MMTSFLRTGFGSVLVFWGSGRRHVTMDGWQSPPEDPWRVIVEEQVGVPADDVLGILAGHGDRDGSRVGGGTGSCGAYRRADDASVASGESIDERSGSSSGCRRGRSRADRRALGNGCCGGMDFGESETDGLTWVEKVGSDERKPLAVAAAAADWRCLVLGDDCEGRATGLGSCPADAD